MAFSTEPTFTDDDQVMKLYKKARSVYVNGDCKKALEMLDDLISAHSEDCNSWILHIEQGEIFLELARKVQKTDMAIVYLLGALGCISEDIGFSGICVRVLHNLAEDLGSVFYYKKCLEKRRQDSSFRHPNASNPLLKAEDKEELAKIIKHAEFMITVSKNCSIENCELKVWEPKKTPDPPEDNRVKGLRSYWMGLDVKSKRDFMKVSVAKLKNFVNGVHKAQGRDFLEKLLAIARKNGKWTCCICRTTCLDIFVSSAEEFKTHLEQQHAAGFKTSSEKDIVRGIGKNWVHKILVGGWEPVNVVAAVDLIKNNLADVIAFTSKSKKKGWSNEWPLAADEERSNLLKEIKFLLLSLCDRQILSCSIRDWMMRFPAKYLGELEVSEESLIASRLVETPQSICFLERHDLIKIRDFLYTIKCERHDGNDMVSRAVDSLLDRTRITENIDFDTHFSLLLLDKRLLKSNNAPYVDDGKINIIDDPNAHYAKAQAQGDNIISWLVDYSSVDKRFPSPREHNLDIWVAVLRAVQYTCRALGTKYAKKKQVLDYEAGLTVVENLCMSEVERRRNVQKDQWKSYASLLCNRCEESIPGNFLTSKLFLCAVRDVFSGAWDRTFDFPDLDYCLNLIREGKSLNDDKVLMSIGLVKSVVTEKVLRIDSKILLIDTSRIRLLNNLTRLSIFDNRSFMLQFLKPFLLNEIVNMEAKDKSDAAEADLLLQEEEKSLLEEKKSQAKKKKKIKSIKITSTSMSRPLDKTVEHKSSVNLEPQATSPSLKTLEEDPVEPEDTLASEQVPSGIASNTDIQEEATNVNPGDMQNMPGEDSLSGHLESALGGAAARYNSALDMTLKALMNINVLKENLKHNKQPFHDDLEEQVPDALQDLFTAVVSGEIKTEGGVYSYILRELLALLEEVNSMACDAAEVLIIILEFWHCWKNAERESLVSRLFTLEENERMTCRKCRRKPNYLEQFSYGIVIAADSIRDLKRTFGIIKFVEILKVIRAEYKMVCDIKTGGCGKTNFVHHIITKCPPIFTIVLEWEKSETEKAISETAKALEWEIDISRLYEGSEPNNNYRLVSMVGYGEEGEHICLAYEKNRWVNLRRESLAGEVVGNWTSVVRFCGGMKVRPVILLYEAARSMMA